MRKETDWDSNSIGEEAEGPVVITDLDFAYDLALLLSEIKTAQEMLTRLEDEAIKVGLKLNVKKSKIIIFNEEADRLIHRF